MFFNLCLFSKKDLVIAKIDFYIVMKQSIFLCFGVNFLKFQNEIVFGIERRTQIKIYNNVILPRIFLHSRKLQTVLLQRNLTKMEDKPNPNQNRPISNTVR